MKSLEFNQSELRNITASLLLIYVFPDQMTFHKFNVFSQFEAVLTAITLH